jgi:hypothetical protein
VPVATPTAWDEYLIHQLPELLTTTAIDHQHWRESLFFDIHDPSGEGDALFLTFARYPGRRSLDSLQMGRVGGEQILGLLTREAGDDPHATRLPGVEIEVVTPWQEVRLHTDADLGGFGLDLTFHARTRPYVLRRGSMRAGNELIWDQRHILQSGRYDGTYTHDGMSREINGWVGQRDHSWGIRDHGRCPLWLWFQIQLDDGFLGVWHWELANGATIYTDGCWAATDGSDPVPIVEFSQSMQWVDSAGAPASYGTNGEAVAGLAGTARFSLADGRTITVDASGSFARPYEPFHRGGLNLMRVTTDDGRRGTAIYEVTGARHHAFFPDTIVDGTLPA